MSAAAIVMMILILIAVWGGFAYALLTAMRKEAEKQRADDVS